MDRKSTNRPQVMANESWTAQEPLADIVTASRIINNNTGHKTTLLVNLSPQRDM